MFQYKSNSFLSFIQVEYICLLQQTKCTVSYIYITALLYVYDIVDLVGCNK
jgi:hypothetical protein